MKALLILVLATTFTGAARAGTDELEPFARFARELAADFNHNQSDVFDRSFDTDAFIARIERKVREKRGIPASLYVRLRLELLGLGKTLLTNVGNDARWRFLRTSPGKDGLTQALIRVDTDEDGLLYLQFKLMRVNDKLRIVDWYNYASALHASDSIGTALHVFAATDKPTERVAFNRFLRAVKNGDNAQARTIYSRFPAAMRRNPDLLTLLIDTAEDDDSAYRKALADLASVVGDDARYAFALVDHYTYQKDYDAALRAIDRFSSLIGDDAALQGLRGNLRRLSGQRRLALSHYRRALELEPDYEDAYLNLLDVLVEEQHYAEAVLVLRILSGRFGYEFTSENMAEIEGYAGFRASHEYQAWLGEL